MFQRKLNKCNIFLESYGDPTVKFLGITTLSCQCNNLKLNLDFIVVDGKGSPLIGLKACNKLELIRGMNSFAYKFKEKHDFVKSYEGIFTAIRRKIFSST